MAKMDQSSIPQDCTEVLLKILEGKSVKIKQWCRLTKRKIIVVVQLSSHLTRIPNVFRKKKIEEKLNC